MPPASETPTIRCPQCRATLAVAHKQAGDAALHVCQFCDTVVLGKQGQLKVAGRQHAGDENVDWLHALCCRLCGGSMGLAAAASPEKAKCTYCGHRARLKPGIISVLRLLFTDPKLLPPSLRRRVAFSLAMVVATIAMTAFMVITESGWRLERFTVDINAVKAGDVLFDQEVDLPGFAKTLDLDEDSRNPPTGLELETLFVHAGSESCFALRARPQGHRVGQRKIAIPGGKTRAFVRVLSRTPLTNGIATDRGATDELLSSGNPKKKDAIFYIESRHKFSLGYMILALNLLLWLSFATMRIGVDFQSTKRRAAQVVQALTFGLLALWFCMTVLDINPFGPRSFSPNDATSYSEHGLACEELLQKGATGAPVPALVAALEKAVALTQSARAKEWEGISASLASEPPALALAPCTPSNGRAIRKFNIEQIHIDDFNGAKSDWASEQSHAMIIAQRVANWRGTLAPDESPAESLARAELWAKEANIDDHALMILEPSPKEGSAAIAGGAGMGGAGTARLFVWSYKKNSLICASPPTVVDDLAKPDMSESIGRLRAVQSAAP